MPVGDKRIEHNMARVDGFMTDVATRVMTEMVQHTGRRGSGSVAQLAWVPETWKEQA